jgi:FAD-dependent monooxygenase
MVGGFFSLEIQVRTHVSSLACNVLKNLNPVPVHRAPPHGGYGMNFGVEEAIDLGFKIAAALKGYSGPLLLQSYGLERRPMMIRALEWSDRHVQEQVRWFIWSAEQPGVLNEDSPAGDALRKKIRNYLTESGSECTSRGIELDSRYRSPVIYQDTDGTKEPGWDYYHYTPSTRPGARAPHVFLKDGKTSTVDLYGKEWSLVEFTSSPANPSAIPIFMKVAAQLNIPLTLVHIQNEDHVRAIWERNIVLVRPDGHVAWRNNNAPRTDAEVQDIFDVVVGKKSFPGWVAEPPRHGRFNSIIEAVNSAPDGDPKFLAAFQKEIN